MKKYFPSLLVMSIGIGFIALGISINKRPVKKIPVDIQYLKLGDTLLPSYACPDTLIVTNEHGINKAMALLEQGIIDVTDYQIDSILHTNCKPINF